MAGRVILEQQPRPRLVITAGLASLRLGLDEATPAALLVAHTLADETWPAPACDGPPELQLAVPAGSLVVGLALVHDSVLLPTPPDKVLNRNVRGLLRGLGAQYFGTQHLVLDGRPIAWLGYDHDEAGRLLLTAIVGVDAPLATIPATDLRGRAWASLHELGVAGDFAELAARVVDGYQRKDWPGA